MGDSKEFQINISTAADTAGAQQAAKSLDEVTAAQERASAAAKRAAEIDRELEAAMAGYTAQQVPKESHEAFAARMQAAEAELAARAAAMRAAQGTEEIDARVAAILRQRVEILGVEKEAMTLRVEGSTEEAAAMETELAIRRESLAIQQATRIPEEEAFAMAKERVALRAQEARLAAETAAADEADAAAQQSKVIRGAARASGLGRDTGILGALGGPELLAAGIGYEVIKAFFDAFDKQIEEAKKKVAEATKAAADSVKELAEASKKSLAEARAEAESYVTALGQINSAMEKGQQRYDKEQELSTRRSLNQIDQQEIGDLAGAPDEVSRQKIKAKAEQDRAQVRADAEVASAKEKADAAKREQDNAQEMQGKAKAELPDAQNDLAAKQALAAESRNRLKEADKELIRHEEAQRVVDEATGGFKMLPDGPTTISARKQRDSAKQSYDKDQENLDAAQSKVNQLTKVMQDLGEKAEEAAKKARALADEQSVISDEAAVKVARAADVHQKAISAAEKAADEKAEHEKERLAAANKQGVEAVAHDDKVTGEAVGHGAERGAEHGSERGVASGLSKHSGHHGAGHTGSGHAGHQDGLGPELVKATDFDAAFHGRLQNANPGAELDKAFGPKADNHQIDTRTGADKRGAAEEHAREADGHIAAAEAVITSALTDKAHPIDEEHKKLVAVIQKLITTIKDLERRNKDDSKAKELKQLVDRLVEDVAQIKSQAKNGGH